LNTPLLQLGPDEFFRLEQACTGVHVFGGIGQGKSSGSGKMLAGAYLRAGFGGLVTAVKPEEIALWKRYAAEHGRSDSLILFDENESFNFLAYELARQGTEGVGTVVECLMRVLETARKASATGSQRGGDPFWSDTTMQTLRCTIPPVYAATGSLSIDDIVRFINSAPTSPAERKDPEWQKHSFLYAVLDAAARNPVVPMAEATLRDCIDYWGVRFPAIPEKTRGNIVISVTTVLDRFKHGRLQRAFCGRTTLVPEMSFLGAVIVLCMPTLTWNEDGIIAQQLFKFLWQRAVLTRNSLAQKYRERPVFLFSDEAQETVSSYDGVFLGLARASKACTVYLTQSLPTYYAKMGGDNPRDDAHGLVGKFMTHVYHGNSCPETNDFAARTIGKVMKRHGNYNAGSAHSTNVGLSSGSNESSGTSSNYSHSAGTGGQSSSGGGSGSNSSSGSNWGANRGRGTSRNVSRGFSESMEFAMEPGDFARILRNGGKQNGGIVTGVWFETGRVFKNTGTNMMIATFKQ
jgi:uncharacterized membrane protein YgcG